jgi:hypothetical protein
MIQKFGFDFSDPYYSVGGIEFAFRVCTLDNVYGIDPACATCSRKNEQISISSEGYQFAGGQKTCPGKLNVEINYRDASMDFIVRANHHEVIKGITILIRRLAAPVSEEKIYQWPTPDVYTPSFPHIITPDGKPAYILPDRTTLRHRRWAVYKEYSGEYVFNLTEDEEYTNRSTKMTGSKWTLIRDQDEKSVSDRWHGMLSKERGLKPWQERADVPSWFREVSLVLNMHCEGWTGYVFNTFEKQLEILKWISGRIKGESVLVYLAGWDGRYYWNYPIYEPSADCGGVDGLQILVDGAHQLGMHVLPMFGVIASNYKNTKEMGFQSAASRSAYDIQEICDWTEWDEDLATEPIWQPLNVGELKFRNHLLNRIYALTDQFQMDGVVLDISGWLPKDPRHNLYNGLSALITTLQTKYTDFLIFGENGSDLHWSIIPVYHHGAHLDPDHPFHTYCRSAYHLCQGAPGKGSTGVFEGGINPYQKMDIDNPAIPTLAIVHDTMLSHSDEMKKIIDLANKWADKWL